MPPALSRAMVRVLTSQDESDYGQLARDLSKAEGAVIDPTAARQRVSRAVRRLEQAIRIERWTTPTAPERVAIIFEPTRPLRVRRTRHEGQAQQPSMKQAPESR